eukprot:Colp12_sorted_trinity150504_noHs@12400
MEELIAWRDELFKHESCTDAIRNFCTAATLQRYLTARGDNAKSAIKALEASLEWRESYVPDGKIKPCTACAEDPTSHCIINLGQNDNDEAIIYMSPPRARNLQTDPCVTHLVAELEAGFLNEGEKAHKAIWFMDCRGYSLMSGVMHPGVGIAYARVMQSHY